MPFSHESKHTELMPSMFINLLLAVSTGKPLHGKGLTNLKATPILPAALISFCALPGRFRLPAYFFKHPPRFFVCFTDRSGPLVFECSLRPPYGPSLKAPSCTLPCL